jgi:ankyrin repeat protein
VEFIGTNANASVGHYGSRERGIPAGVAQLLPELGSDMINIQDENRMTPSHLQSDFGPVQIALALLDHGANVNAGIKGETPSSQESNGE